MPSPSLLDKAERRKKFFNEDYSLKIPNIKNKEKIRESMNWKAIIGSDCDKTFLDLVKKCLQWDPS